MGLYRRALRALPSPEIFEKLLAAFVEPLCRMLSHCQRQVVEQPTHPGLRPVVDQAWVSALEDRNLARRSASKLAAFTSPVSPQGFLGETIELARHCVLFDLPIPLPRVEGGEPVPKLGELRPRQLLDLFLQRLNSGHDAEIIPEEPRQFLTLPERYRTTSQVPRKSTTTPTARERSKARTVSTNRPK